MYIYGRAIQYSVGGMMMQWRMIILLWQHSEYPLSYYCYRSQFPVVNYLMSFVVSVIVSIWATRKNLAWLIDWKECWWNKICELWTTVLAVSRDKLIKTSDILSMMLVVSPNCVVVDVVMAPAEDMCDWCFNTTVFC